MAGRPRCPGRSKHHLPLGAALPADVRRSGSKAHPVGPDWRVHETYARIRGRWHYIYRAIDGCGQLVDAYVSPTRDMVAARRFFERAIASSGTTPRRIITDDAGAYPPALPRWYRACCIELVATASMASNVTTASCKNASGRCAG